MRGIIFWRFVKIFWIQSSPHSNQYFHFMRKPKTNSNRIQNLHSFKRDKFLDIAKSMLIKLADKRKSIRKQTKQRRKYTKAEKSRKKKQLLEEKIKQFEKQNKVIDIENLVQHQQNNDCLIVQGQRSQTPKTREVNTSSSFQKPIPKNQRIMLYKMSLHNLISIFVQEIQNPVYKCNCSHRSSTQQKCICKCGTGVHRAIRNNEDICAQVKRLKELTQKQGHYFNEDRFIILQNNEGLDQYVFAKDIITPYEHRGLSILLKRINYEKYSIDMEDRYSNISFHRQRNSLGQNFFSLQYKIPLYEYYKQILEFEIKYKRYIAISTLRSNPVIGAKQENNGPSNLVRKLMEIVFKSKIKGEGDTLDEILKLEQKINISLAAQRLLKQMRSGQNGDNMNEQAEKKSHKKKKAQQKKQAIKASKGLKEISQQQKQAIEKALDDVRRNRKQVPYPYCMFLQYRLRAQRQPHYQNPHNLSSDSDSDLEDDELYQLAKSRKIFKDMNVYKGYRGYKTSSRIAQTRKANKGIIVNTRLLSNPEQFYLKSLQPDLNHPPPTNINQSTERTQNQPQQSPHNQQKNEQNPEIVPYPYCLSIFAGYQKIQKNNKISQQYISQQHENKTSLKFSQKRTKKSQTRKERKTSQADNEVIELID